MGAGCEQERLAGFGVEAVDPVGHELRVGALLGSVLPARLNAVRIVFVRRVDRGESGFKAAVPSAGSVSTFPRYLTECLLSDIAENAA